MAKKNTTSSKKTVTVELAEPAGASVVSKALSDAVRNVLREELCDGKGEAKLDENGRPVTISGREVAKRLLGQFAVTNEQMLYLIVNVAIATGAVPGFTSKLGRNGGIFRIPATE